MSITTLARRIALLETVKEDQCPAWGMAALLHWAQQHAGGETELADDAEPSCFAPLLAEARAWLADHAQDPSARG